MNDRIPRYDAAAPDGMIMWFAELQARGLLFHPEEDPADIIRIEDGARVFDDEEASRVRGILQSMEEEHGDGMIEACYPVFMRACGQRLDA